MHCNKVIQLSIFIENHADTFYIVVHVIVSCCNPKKFKENDYTF